MTDTRKYFCINTNEMTAGELHDKLNSLIHDGSLPATAPVKGYTNGLEFVWEKTPLELAVEASGLNEYDLYQQLHERFGEPKDVPEDKLLYDADKPQVTFIILDDIQVDILKALMNGPMAVREIRNRLGYETGSAPFDKLFQANLIHYGADGYKITAAGVEWLQKNGHAGPLGVEQATNWTIDLLTKLRSRDMSAVELHSSEEKYAMEQLVKNGLAHNIGIMYMITPKGGLKLKEYEERNK